MNIIKFWQLPFVQTEIAPAEQQVGKLKLSEAIRYGIAFVPEQRGFHGCALGCAHFALAGEICFLASWESIANLGGWPHELCRQISNNHYWGRWSREQCADYAERQGC